MISSPAPTGRDLFALVAPRLERAHRERKVEMVAERLARHVAREQEMRMERLVAHRELQLLRAATTGNVKYERYRARKLDMARAMLTKAQATSRRLGA